MTLRALWRGGRGLKNMKVKAQKVSVVMKVTMGGMRGGIRHSEGGKDVMSVVWVAMSPQRRVESGREVSIPGRVLSHLRPGIKPIFQPQDNKAQG